MVSVSDMIATAKKQVAKGSKKAGGKDSEDFEVDLDDTSRAGSAGKKAQRSKRRAAKAAADEKPAKGAAKKASKKSAAKAERSSKRADKKAEKSIKTDRKSRRAEKAAKGNGRANGHSVEAYKGSLADQLATKLNKPGKFDGSNPVSAANHFAFALNKAASKQYATGKIASSLAGATKDTFGAKLGASEFGNVAKKIQSLGVASLARSAKKPLADIKAKAKAGSLTQKHITDAVNSLLE